MSAQLKPNYISQDEYFDILLNGDIKYEWFNGQMWPKENPDGLPVAMAGAQPVHSDIKNNIETPLTIQLGDGPCRVRSSDQQVKIKASDLIAFPDITVVCDAPQYEVV